MTETPHKKIKISFSSHLGDDDDENFSNQCIYILFSKHMRFLKIGMSEKVISENDSCDIYMSYRRYYPDHKMFIFMINGDLNINDVEKYVHKKLDKYRIKKGEHFRCSVKLAMKTCMYTQIKFNKSEEITDDIKKDFRESIENDDGFLFNYYHMDTDICIISNNFEYINKIENKYHPHNDDNRKLKLYCGVSTEYYDFMDYQGFKNLIKIEKLGENIVKFKNNVYEVVDDDVDEESFNIIKGKRINFVKRLKYLNYVDDSLILLGFDDLNVLLSGGHTGQYSPDAVDEYICYLGVDCEEK